MTQKGYGIGVRDRLLAASVGLQRRVVGARRAFASSTQEGLKHPQSVPSPHPLRTLVRTLKTACIVASRTLRTLFRCIALYARKWSLKKSRFTLQGGLYLAGYGIAPVTRAGNCAETAVDPYARRFSPDLYKAAR
jgi:hypothetical protein